MIATVLPTLVLFLVITSLLNEGFLIEDIFTTYKLMNKSKRILLSDKAYYFYRRRETGLCLNPDPAHVYKKQMSYYRAFYERYEFVSVNQEFSKIFEICQEKAFSHGRNLLHVNIKNKLDKGSSGFYEIMGDLSLMNLIPNLLISKGKKIEQRIIRNMPSKFYILLIKIFYIFRK